MASVWKRFFHRWCIFPGAQAWSDVEARPGVGNVISARSRRWVSRKSSQERPSTRGKMRVTTPHVQGRMWSHLWILYQRASGWPWTESEIRPVGKTWSVRWVTVAPESGGVNSNTRNPVVTCSCWSTRWEPADTLGAHGLCCSADPVARLLACPFWGCQWVLSQAIRKGSHLSGCVEGPEPSIVPKDPGASSLSLKVVFPENSARMYPLKVECGGEVRCCLLCTESWIHTSSTCSKRVWGPGKESFG